MKNNNYKDTLIWHPFTQEKTAEAPLHIVAGKGSYLIDKESKKYLDLISSWWVNLHGHANPYIAQSIYKQALTLEHVIFAGFTHTPAETLCENLSQLLPQELSKFFFSDNGSTSTEIAIKMAYQYWYNLGESKKKLFLSFEGGYHGDTFGAMAVGNSNYHTTFKELFFQNLVIPYPATWDNDEDVSYKEQHALNVLDGILEKYHDRIAAIILEPLIQGASGMRLCRGGFLKKVIEILKQNNILIIFDEVMTGFGRTGSLFALNQLEDFTPDFLCLSKGITGGFLPLGLTVTTPKIYQAFWHNEWKYAFAHGHSYTANPLACSATVTSLELTLKALKSTIPSINNIHKEGLDLIKNSCKKAKCFRSLGTIGAFNLELTPKNLSILKQRFLESGLLIRPLNDCIYLLPPYCITPEELSLAYEKISEIVNTISEREGNN